MSHNLGFTCPIIWNSLIFAMWDHVLKPFLTGLLGGGPADKASTDPMAKAHQQIIHELTVLGWKLAALTIVFSIVSAIIWEIKRKARKRDYNETYLNSDAWKRKRAMVLKRDHWQCVYCDSKATEVHHKRYARKIGSEPIDWLVSVCPRCHEMEHPDKQPA